MEHENTLIQAENLIKYFPHQKGIFGTPLSYVQAVDGVSLEIQEGETLGLVGESGCGKSTLGRVMLQLIRQSSGKILYRGQDLSELKGELLRQMRRKIQIIFQDPYASLNPRMTVFENIVSGLDAFGIGTKAEREQKVLKIMEDVGIARHLMHRYPHEFSGGQLGALTLSDFNMAKGIDYLNAEAVGSYTYHYLSIDNQSEKMTQDVRVAIDRAIYKQRIVDGILGGYGDVSIGPWSVKHPYFNSDLPVDNYNPEEAKALLENGTIPNSDEIRFEDEIIRKQKSIW